MHAQKISVNCNKTKTNSPVTDPEIIHVALLLYIKILDHGILVDVWSAQFPVRLTGT